ncbi:MAG: SAM-dependent methyltransferase [Deltaproteobacteria bacterium]|nr:SAM-dependent methyltransferase [Deltaproteobacteria bacterium]
MQHQNDVRPGRILEISGSYWKTCTLHAAVKLGVFTAIGSRMITAEDLAGEMNVDSRALEMLLNALSAMDLLEKNENLFKNTAEASIFLEKSSPAYVGYMIMHHHHLMDSWLRLDSAVTTGKPVRSRATHSDAEWRESFLMGMYNLAMSIAPRIAELIDLQNRRHFLDLGGGPGTYAIHFCLKNPHLNATIYDLPSTEPFAASTIRRFGLQDRVRFESGDYLREEIKGSFDVVWLSQILHGEGPEACQMIIDRAVGAVEPGGLIFVHDFILNNSMDGPLFPALFSLNMLLGTPDGQSYSEEQIRNMLKRAGVKEIRRIPFQGPNDSGIIGGTV